MPDLVQLRNEDGQSMFQPRQVLAHFKARGWVPVEAADDDGVKVAPWVPVVDESDEAPAFVPWFHEGLNRVAPWPNTEGASIAATEAGWVPFDPIAAASALAATIVTGTVDDVLTAVGEDMALAARVADAERAGKGRVTLLNALEALLADEPAAAAAEVVLPPAQPADPLPDAPAGVDPADVLAPADVAGDANT